MVCIEVISSRVLACGLAFDVEVDALSMERGILIDGWMNDVGEVT